MNRRLKWTLAFAFVLVFAAGAMTGSFVGARYMKKHRKKHIMMMSAHHGAAAERMRKHLREELELTPEQAEKMGPIIEAATASLQTIRRETASRVRNTMEEAGREMSPHLTPEQQAKLQQLREQHQQHLRMRRFRGPLRDHAQPPDS